MNNDILGLTLSSITFTGTRPSDCRNLTIEGNALTLTSAVVDDTVDPGCGEIGIEVPVTIPAGINSNWNIVGNTAGLSSALQLLGQGKLSNDPSITGGGGITKTGNGDLSLFSGSYTGLTRIEAGRFLPVHLTTSPILADTGELSLQGGEVSRVTVGPHGVLSVYADSKAQSVQMAAGSLWLEVMDRSCSRVTVSNGIALANSTLTIRPDSILPATGGTCTLIQNDSHGPVQGTFAGLPEGATFTTTVRDSNLNSTQATFRISYRGGDGNDVTLTAVPKPAYVGLGDSYSSGEGNPPFDPGTDVYRISVPTNVRLDQCHRSSASWERILGVTQAMHLACSGALIKNLYQGQEKLAPDNTGQISRLATIESGLRSQGSHVGVVSLTIGGNDIGFGNIIGDCFIRECLAHFDQNEAKVQTVGAAVTQALRDIKHAVPDARIVLVGYPRIFPGQQAGNVSCGWLTPTERTRANTLSAEMDTRWRAAAKSAGVSYVSILNALDGHELCTADSWVFPVNPTLYGTDQRQGHPLLPAQQAIAALVGPSL